MIIAPCISIVVNKTIKKGIDIKGCLKIISFWVYPTLGMSTLFDFLSSNARL